MQYGPIIAQKMIHTGCKIFICVATCLATFGYLPAFTTRSGARSGTVVHGDDTFQLFEVGWVDSGTGINRAPIEEKAKTTVLTVAI